MKPRSGGAAGTVRRARDRYWFGLRVLERSPEKAGKPEALRALIHNGGLRADAVTEGEISVGSAIAPR